MTMELNASGDFALMCDGLEAASLRRAGGDVLPLTAALRVSHREVEAEPSGGAVVRADAVWRVQLPADEPPPRLGEAIVDAAGGRWTILSISEWRELYVWECATRELRIAYGCNDRIDVERPAWEDGEEGPVITGWNYVQTAIPVRIQPDAIVLDESVDPPRGVARWKIILGEQIPLKADDRLTTADGAIYRVLRYEQAERIDALPVATVAPFNSA
jgi:hypothetical protein